MIPTVRHQRCSPRCGQCHPLASSHLHNPETSAGRFVNPAARTRKDGPRQSPLRATYRRHTLRAQQQSIREIRPESQRFPLRQIWREVLEGSAPVPHRCQQDDVL